ncbi:hypothetical protein PG999_007704 [Apiospora kogelbergensis]|uniref:Uncharacterized protein n=1 Tax=Apiospora kogelbergensis TaxID=1337665 RepID=A0AAW0QLS1_9PEZI
MASQSNLSSPKYGYDFVISTTQASINSGLLEFLDNSEQEATCLFFVANEDAVPTEIELDKLLKLSNGVNPFDIPPNTSFDDPRIKKDLIGARFMGAIKIRIGLPPGVMPKDLPSIVHFGSDASSVGFNMFCSELTVINCTPAGYGEGKWDVWEQPSGKSWYFSTLVNLTVAELDKSLDGPIYFQKHTSEKEAILRQLNKISSTSFDLQQILYDLEHAALVALPAIEGIEEGSTPEYLLTRYFINVYAKHCQAEGLPLAAVTATPQSPDPSQLQMTSFQRQVSHLKDDKGNVIANPDMEEQAVTTLDFLCVTDGKPMPGSASFGWNWVEKNEVDDESGMISVNRAAAGHFLVDQMRPAISKHCASIAP